MTQITSQLEHIVVERGFFRSRLCKYDSRVFYFSIFGISTFSSGNVFHRNCVICLEIYEFLSRPFDLCYDLNNALWNRAHKDF